MNNDDNANNMLTYHAKLTGEQGWCTPVHIIESVRNVFNGNISLDPCSNKYSAVNADIEYTLPEHDGLKESWDYDTVYVNPPYGRDKERHTSIYDWMRKTAETRASYGNEIICLIPVAPNTKHWKKYVFHAADCICFLYDTRLKFSVNGKVQSKGAPMPCCVVYYGDNVNAFMNEFVKYGACVPLKNAMAPDVDDNGCIVNR